MRFVMGLATPLPAPSASVAVDESATWIAHSWQWMNDNGAALGFLATVATAYIAVRAIMQASSDSRERSRPVITAELDVAEHNDSGVDLTIANKGQSVARDIVVLFDPPLKAADDGEKTSVENIIKRYDKAISVMAPGQKFVNTWWMGIDAQGQDDLVNLIHTPDAVQITICYRDAQGRHRYKDSYELDVNVLLNHTQQWSSTSFKGRMASIDKSLQGAAGALMRLDRKIPQRGNG